MSKKKFPRVFYIISALLPSEKEFIISNMTQSEDISPLVISYLTELLKGTSIFEINYLENKWISAQKFNRKNLWRIRQKAFNTTINFLIKLLYDKQIGVRTIQEYSLLAYYFLGRKLHTTLVSTILDKINPFDQKLWFFYPPYYRILALRSSLEHIFHIMSINNNTIDHLINAILFQTKVELYFPLLALLMSRVNDHNSIHDFYSHFLDLIPDLSCNDKDTGIMHVNILFIYMIFSAFCGKIGYFITLQQIVNNITTLIPKIMTLSAIIREQYKIPKDVFNTSYLKLFEIILPLLVPYPFKLATNVDNELICSEFTERLLHNPPLAIKFIYYLLFSMELDKAEKLMGQIENIAMKFHDAYSYSYVFSKLLLTYLKRNKKEYFHCFRLLDLKILKKYPILYIAYYLWRIIQLNDIINSQDKYRQIYDIGEAVYKYLQRHRSYLNFGKFIRWFGRFYIRGPSISFWTKAYDRLITAYLHEPNLLYVESHVPFLIWLKSKEKNTTLVEELKSYEGIDLISFENMAHEKYGISIEPSIFHILERLTALISDYLKV